MKEKARKEEGLRARRISQAHSRKREARKGRWKKKKKKKKKI